MLYIKKIIYNNEYKKIVYSLCGIELFKRIESFHLCSKYLLGFKISSKKQNLLFLDKLQFCNGLKVNFVVNLKKLIVLFTNSLYTDISNLNYFLNKINIKVLIVINDAQIKKLEYKDIEYLVYTDNNFIKNFKNYCLNFDEIYCFQDSIYLSQLESIFLNKYTLNNNLIVFRSIYSNLLKVDEYIDSKYIEIINRKLITSAIQYSNCSFRKTSDFFCIAFKKFIINSNNFIDIVNFFIKSDQIKLNSNIGNIFLLCYKDNKYLNDNVKNVGQYTLLEIFFLDLYVGDTEIIYDHSWGGGAEIYILEQINIRCKHSFIIRAQSLSFSTLKISYYYKNLHNSLIMNIDDFFHLQEKISIQRVFINHLANYNDIYGFFKKLFNLKMKKTFQVIFLVHDFLCVCPTVMLLNKDNIFCNLPSKYDCEHCFNCLNKKGKYIYNINEWYENWSIFFKNVVDSIVTFSNNSKDLILKRYPYLKNKLLVVPHKVFPLRLVNIGKHKGINIAILGHVEKHKGLDIVKNLDKILGKYPTINIYIFGSCSLNLVNINIVGRYKRSDLPSLIEKYYIDMVFIPSICPETFSYTTHEAIEMSIPVCCFDLGAQGEAIREYKKGLILQSKDARNILEDIKNFQLSNLTNS